MNAPELRVTREGLGLSIEALATYLSVNERTVRRWEHGDRDIPDEVAREVGSLLAYTEAAYADLVSIRRADYEHGINNPVLVWRTDEDQFNGTLPHHRSDLPASWHRMMMHRLRLVFPDIVLAYGDPSTCTCGHLHSLHTQRSIARYADTTEVVVNICRGSRPDICRCDGFTPITERTKS